MTFGLCNVALRGLDFIFIYIDDICVSSRSPDEYQQYLEIVFQRLQQHNLTINETKCSWGRKSVRFMGHIVNKNGIRPTTEKIDTIRNFKLPLTAQNMQRLIAMLSAPLKLKCI